MFAAISQFDGIELPSPSPPSGMHGAAEVRLVRKDGHTGLADLRQISPLRVLFPIAAAGDPFTAALVTTSGGLVGGDSLSVEVDVGEQASGLFVAQAAEKIYRSTGADGIIDVHLSVGAGGWLEFLPQETILFDNARLRRRTDIEVAPGGRLLAGEILVFGRTARGERMNYGLVHDAWRIKRDDRLAWTDAMHLEGDIAKHLDDPSGFDGCHALATLAFVVDDPIPFLPILRSSPDDLAVRFGATIVNGILIARWLSKDACALRQSFGSAWGELRAAAAQLPKTLPRLWYV